MNKFYSKKSFYLILLLFIFWVLISFYWYVCNINNFCKSEIKNKEIVKVQMIEENYGEFEENNFYEEKKNIIKKTYTCSAYLQENIRVGSLNNINEVIKLEMFLNKIEGEGLIIDGIYSINDKNAVARMQIKHKIIREDQVVLKGIVGPKTRLKINQLYCFNLVKEKFNKSEDWKIKK